MNALLTSSKHMQWDRFQAKGTSVFVHYVLLSGLHVFTCTDNVGCNDMK